MTELAVTVPAHRSTRTRAAVLAALLLAATLLAIALFWPSGGSHRAARPAATPVATIEIPQRLIDQAAQERAAWENVARLVAEQNR